MAVLRTKDQFSDEEWSQIASMALSLQNSLIWRAISARLVERRELARTRLEKATEVKDLFRAQGEVSAYNNDIMVLEDLRESAGKRISTKDKIRHA